MGILDKFEQSVDKMVNGAFAKAFKSEVQPVEIAAALQSEMDERAAVVSRARTVVPNEFTVHLSEVDFERLSVYSEALTGELAGLVREYADEQRFTFLGPIAVYLTQDEEFGTGVFTVTSQAIAGDVAPSAAAAAGAPMPDYRPRLLAAGQEIPLAGPTVVLGRGNEVDVRLEDPGVSRRHAQIVLGDPAVIEDLGSTNGTIVDGTRITRQALSDGSVIRLGSTDVTYRSS